MSDELLEKYIVQHIEATSGQTINFSWHGGEPTLMGLNHFKTIISLQHKHQPPGKQIFNGIQTNGILLDEDWCRFLAEERFGVGLSVDGPQELHDCYRVTRTGASAHMQVMHAFDLLKRNGIPCDILCAVHDRNVRYPLEVYRYFKAIGGQFISFLPVVAGSSGSDARTEPWSVPAEDFGEFLCAIFDEWQARDIGRVSVQIFEEAIRPLQGQEHSLCIFRETCGEIPVVERNGDFFACDHFVNEAHRFGNIRHTPLERLLESREQRQFGEAKRTGLPRYCRECPVLDMCNGGCPKDRFVLTPDSQPGLNYLCAGYKRFFTHCRPYFYRVIAAAQARQPDSGIAGRNDPCPCGSGMKYKKCCLGKGPKRGATDQSVQGMHPAPLSPLDREK
jgi:uncharacterized protein